MPKPVSADDFRLLARRRMPRIAFDFVDGGAGTEAAVRRNTAAFERLTVRPRVLRDCEVRSTATTLLGQTYSAPIGIAPIGLANLAWPGTDIALARLGAESALPYVLSTAATTSLEDACAVAGNKMWFQLYVGQDRDIVMDLVVRARTAGVDTLIVTLDVPTPGKRLRDLRNGFTLPLRLSLRMMLDVASHPRWALATLRNGAPRFANLERYSAGSSAASLAELMASQSTARLDYAILAELREHWPGKFLVKGLLHPDDAVAVRDLGVNGIIVSNHGGRQLGAAIASLDALPAIRAAVGEDFAVLLDGGIRSGEDVLLALASGADMVLIGRPFVWSVAARGPNGPAEFARMLILDIDRGLAQLGVASIDQLRRERTNMMLQRGLEGFL